VSNADLEMLQYIRQLPLIIPEPVVGILPALAVGPNYCVGALEDLHVYDAQRSWLVITIRSCTWEPGNLFTSDLYETLRVTAADIA